MRRCPQLLRLHVLAVALLLALPSPSVLAKGPGDSPVARAERAQGMVALNLGRYDEAIEHLSQAYTLTQDPALLFSLGQAYRLAGKPEKALATYSSFLRVAGPGAKNRAQVERAASEIETITSFILNRPADRAGQDKQLDNLMAAPAAGKDLAPPPQTEKEAEPAEAKPPPLALAPPPPPPPPPASLLFAPKTNPPAQPAPSHVYKKWWFWTSVGVALAAGGAAAWWFTRPENQTPASTYGAIRVLQ
ncbi:MAG: tetratricopeptide repeat protein [Polyangia bacterium]|jgi:tetratricopeptide (TPR) repeat protein